jgi:hypothetical protein
VVLVAAFAVSQTCQKDQIRITKDAAIATAREQVDFRPTRTQVRLLGQGLSSKPTWIVSLSIPQEGEPIDTQEFSELAVVRIDANTGKIIDVKVQR